MFFKATNTIIYLISSKAVMTFDYSAQVTLNEATTKYVDTVSFFFNFFNIILIIDNK